MVIAGAACDEELLEKLKEIGVKDSKQLAPKKRESIGEILRDLPGLDIEVETIPPAEIDAAVRNRSLNLNGMTLCKMAAIIDRLRPEEVYVDMVGNSAAKMETSILRLLDFTPRITAQPRADSEFVITAAASIIAKTTRDAAVRELGKRFVNDYGPLGSGYPSDPRTQAFIRAAWKEEGIIRRTWGTCKGLG